MQCMFCNHLSDPFLILQTTIAHCPSCRFQWTYSFLERNCSRYLFRCYKKHHKYAIPDKTEVRILPALQIFTSHTLPDLFVFNFPYLSSYPYNLLNIGKDLIYFYENLYPVYMECQKAKIDTNRNIHTRSILLSYLNNCSPIIKYHKIITNDTMLKLSFDVIRLCCIRDITYQLLHSVLRYYPTIHARKRFTVMGLIRSRYAHKRGFLGGTLNVKKNAMSIILKSI